MARSGVIIGTVADVWRYPVASLGGETLAAAEVTPLGLPGDRNWAVASLATGETGMAARGRRWRALVQASARYLAEVPRDAEAPAVELRFPDGSTAQGGEAAADDKLSRLVGHPVRLGRSERSPGGSGDRVPTAYAFTPLHLLSTASLDQLQALYPEGRSDVRRFRPNIVIETAGPRGFLDGDWIGRQLRIGDAVLAASAHCKRCAMTTNAQGDLAQDPGILRMVTRENHSNMGVYAEVARPGMISRGDDVLLF